MTGSKVSSRARMYEEDGAAVSPSNSRPSFPSFSLPSSFLPFFLSSFFFPFFHSHTRLRAVRSSRRHSLARSRSFQETLFTATSESEWRRSLSGHLATKGVEKLRRDRFSHYIHRAFLVFRALDSNEISKERFAPRDP